ncbi:NADP-dependent isocitrate dehydrogenase [Mucilaginibacter achroorhodeus]|uniref:Isocitrate dehydrogenase [NADP] n=1 Tax=Mucilaginibacter achroorhodeus TaxID=2599294 RepID=A0A563U6R8_9SPHI|nr:MULTISPECIES: NADP-dependent isocitrate dehydrogenase [Mucilaginibacter]QXV64896.1 NADP-dependent isocitrate dehydrogenase [Mucilaginibacter sp. 21P]TWR27046.1 NADP-dependent isocitrate dehydrogenase [Mucilaginibacter achroorhodeus]
MSTKIAVAKGDGIGPEIMAAVLRIFEAANVPLEYEYVEMGKSYFDAGHSTGMTPAAKETIERLGLLFKGPMETPKGKGVKSINVTARKVWNTYANQRDFRSLNGVDTVFSKAGIPINLTIVRENIEDTYGGIEHLLTNDVAVGRRIITRPGSAQVIRYAFEMARRKGYTKLACGHKANIMKLTDGMFLETFYEIAKEFPDIESSDIIVDDLCMKLVSRPEIFQAIVLTNLQGDIVSDLCAGLVGGLGFAPSANIGDNISIFEAVHGTAPDIQGKGIANPTALLLSGILMLRYLGYTTAAAAIENSLLYTLEQGIHTGDFGDKSTPSANTEAFADAVIANLGQVPVKGAVVAQPDMEVKANHDHPTKNKLTVVKKDSKEEIVGVDVFVESNKQPNELAEIAQKKLNENTQLVMISNRGTQVWPTGSIYTELVNEYRIRVEKKDGGEISQKEILHIAGELSEDFKICSVEFLMKFDGKIGYTLAQGQ